MGGSHCEARQQCSTEGVVAGADLFVSLSLIQKENWQRKTARRRQTVELWDSDEGQYRCDDTGQRSSAP